MNLPPISKDPYLPNILLFISSILSDVTFIVGRDTQQQRIPAHRFVLSVGSAVFDAMFNSTLATRYVFKMICLSCNVLPNLRTHLCLMYLQKLYQNKKSQTVIENIWSFLFCKDFSSKMFWSRSIYFECIQITVIQIVLILLKYNYQFIR